MLSRDACCVCCAVQLTYVSFGVVWDLDLFRLLDPATEEAMYLFAELASKVRIAGIGAQCGAGQAMCIRVAASQLLREQTNTSSTTATTASRSELLYVHAAVAQAGSDIVVLIVVSIGLRGRGPITQLLPLPKFTSMYIHALHRLRVCRFCSPRCCCSATS